jgi:hypothetical protein
MDTREKLIEAAQRQVADAQLRVMQQKALVAALAAQGADTAQAQTLLATFEKLLEAMRHHAAVEAQFSPSMAHKA